MQQVVRGASRFEDVLPEGSHDITLEIEHDLLADVRDRCAFHALVITDDVFEFGGLVFRDEVLIVELQVVSFGKQGTGDTAANHQIVNHDLSL
ncbi:hypothetical protein D3C78_1756750 [compost metagenome]